MIDVLAAMIEGRDEEIPATHPLRHWEDLVECWRPHLSPITGAIAGGSCYITYWSPGRKSVYVGEDVDGLTAFVINVIDLDIDKRRAIAPDTLAAASGIASAPAALASLVAGCNGSVVLIQANNRSDAVTSLLVMLSIYANNNDRQMKHALVIVCNPMAEEAWVKYVAKAREDQIRAGGGFALLLASSANTPEETIAAMSNQPRTAEQRRKMN